MRSVLLALLLVAVLVLMDGMFNRSAITLSLWHELVEFGRVASRIVGVGS